MDGVSQQKYMFIRLKMSIHSSSPQSGIHAETIVCADGAGATAKVSRPQPPETVIKRFVSPAAAARLHHLHREDEGDAVAKALADLKGDKEDSEGGEREQNCREEDRLLVEGRGATQLDVVLCNRPRRVGVRVVDDRVNAAFDGVDLEGGGGGEGCGSRRWTSAVRAR